MAKQLQLTIPIPCHEDWDAMTPVDKGKFCGSCQKHVVDFSNMSDRQVAEFFKKPSSGSVCGRFMNDQLDRSIDIPGKRIPWVKYFFQIALPAFLLTLKSSAQKSQGKIKINAVVAKNKPVIGDTLTLPEIVITSVNSQQMKGKIVPNISNLLSSRILGPDIITTKSPDISASRDLSICSANPLQQLTGTLGGVIVIAGGVSVRKTPAKKRKLIPLITQIFKDSSANNFSVFPNPVVSGTSITLNWKQSEEGNYSVQLVDLPGQIVHQKEIAINKKDKQLHINIPAVAAGNYFLVLINKKTSKKSTEKIIIQ